MNNDGGCAFPCDSREAREFAGMSLRDWFAGQALCGLFACTSEEDRARFQTEELTKEQIAEWYAQCAYLTADAMLAERNKDR